jgi:hypothetical protein
MAFSTSWWRQLEPNLLFQSGKVFISVSWILFEKREHKQWQWRTSSALHGVIIVKRGRKISFYFEFSNSKMVYFINRSQQVHRQNWLRRATRIVLDINVFKRWTPLRYTSVNEQFFYMQRTRNIKLCSLEIETRNFYSKCCMIYFSCLVLAVVPTYQQQLLFHAPGAWKNTNRKQNREFLAPKNSEVLVCVTK